MLVKEAKSVEIACEPDSIQKLQAILASIGLLADYDEAQELGAGLIEFYEMLAEEAGDGTLA